MTRLYQAPLFPGNKTTVAAPDSAPSGQESVLWKLALLAALAYLVWSDRPLAILSEAPAQSGGETFGWQWPFSKSKKAARAAQAQVTLAPDELGNATFAIDPGFAQRHEVARAEVTARMAKCRDYVDRFAPVAMAEMRKFGIPASITLAQALLESDAGDSRLAREANNHFGIKCHAKRCKRGHCINYADDSHKDFFVKYPNAWSSFRAHSQNLKNKPRYADLFELAPTDYRGWANGLAQAGYATDKRYGDKLIALIERFELSRFDRPVP